MKRIIYFIVLASLFVACVRSHREKKTGKMEVVPVNMNRTSTTNNIIDKIEMIPLETTDQSLIDGVRKIMYAEEEGLFLVVDKRNVISIFTDAGEFYANSESLMGDAPQQYNSIVDVSYCKRKKSIEIMTINGEIKSYDLTLTFNGYKKITIEGYIPSQFMALDSSVYVTSPTINQNENLFFVDTKSQDLWEAYYDNSIANITMDVNAFYNIGDRYFFVPKGINYYFYEIDKKKKDIYPFIYLDFLGDIIDVDKLPGDVNFGKYDSEKRNMINYFKEMKKRDDYLVESGYYLPIIKFFNEKYVYIHAIKKRKPYNYIYNRTTKETFVQQGNVPVSMRFCLGINDNVLYTYINPYKIEKYYDADLITTESKERIAKVQEEDNIIIVKYHLK